MKHSLVYCYWCLYLHVTFIIMHVHIFIMHPSKHFLFSKTSWRRLQRNTFRLPRRLKDVFKTYLQYIFLKRLQDVFKTFSRRLQDVFQDVFKTCLQDVLQLYLQDVLEDKKNVTLKTSSRRLQDVFSMSSPRRRFTGMHVEIQKVIL